MKRTVENLAGSLEDLGERIPYRTKFPDLMAKIKRETQKRRPGSIPPLDDEHRRDAMAKVEQSLHAASFRPYEFAVSVQALTLLNGGRRTRDRMRSRTTVESDAFEILGSQYRFGFQSLNDLGETRYSMHIQRTHNSLVSAEKYGTGSYDSVVEVETSSFKNPNGKSEYETPIVATYHVEPRTNGPFVSHLTGLIVPFEMGETVKSKGSIPVSLPLEGNNLRYLVDRAFRDYMTTQR